MKNVQSFLREKFDILMRLNRVVDIVLEGNVNSKLNGFIKNFTGEQYQCIDITLSDPFASEKYINPLAELSDNYFDALICGSVLDHVPEPRQIVKETHRILRPGGHEIAYLPFLYSYHGSKDSYRDFFRFTLDGIRYLFKDFTSLEYIATRGRWTSAVQLLPIGSIKKLAFPITAILDSIKYDDHQAAGYYIFATK